MVSNISINLIKELLEHFEQKMMNSIDQKLASITSLINVAYTHHQHELAEQQHQNHEKLNNIHKHLQSMHTHLDTHFESALRHQHEHLDIFKANCEQILNSHKELKQFEKENDLNNINNHNEYESNK